MSFGQAAGGHSRSIFGTRSTAAFVVKGTSLSGFDVGTWSSLVTVDVAGAPKQTESNPTIAT